MTFGLCASCVIMHLILSFSPLITVVPCVAGIFTAFAWAPAGLIGNNVVRIGVKAVIFVFFIALELCVWINSTLPWLERKFPNRPNIRVLK